MRFGSADFHKKSIQLACDVNGICGCWSIFGIWSAAAFSGTEHDALFHFAIRFDHLCFFCFTKAGSEHGGSF